ncbi:MAG: alanyl-tRNA editing protein, partial [Candidatus Eiseniibacteriota bacterium]
MSSERLYYDDAYTARFTARVAALGELRGRPAVELERTYFYPESGGQEADRGTVAGTPVTDVQADAEERVWHALDPVGAAPDPGSEVACEVDWARRFDHMQQHTGQHVLSAALERVLSAPTISSHLGVERSTIEVALPGTDWRAIERVEDAANRVVWEDRPVERHWTDASGLARFKLRKPPQVAGRIRIVEIPEWDVSACGGTHTRRTGEVGVIKIVGWEKLRGNLRLEFLCGGRALRDHAWRTEALVDGARRRTLKDRDLIAHLERAVDERNELRKRLDALSEQVLTEDARRRVGDPPRGVADFSASRPRDEVRRFALKCLEAGAPWVVAGAASPDPVVVIGRTKALAADLRALLPALLERARGRGGGSPD